MVLTPQSRGGRVGRRQNKSQELRLVRLRKHGYILLFIDSEISREFPPLFTVEC
jgi:hypothetical protein